MATPSRYKTPAVRAIALVLAAATIIYPCQTVTAQTEETQQNSTAILDRTPTPDTTAPTDIRPALNTTDTTASTRGSGSNKAGDKLTKIKQAATQYSPDYYPEPQGAFMGSHDSHTLPLIYMAGNDDYSKDNRALRKYFEGEKIRIYDWYPTEVTDQANVRKFQHPEWYIPYVDAFIKDVMRKTGSSKVNIMTFSQSGVIAATWMKNHGGAQYVDQVVNVSAALQGSPTATIGNELLPECLGIKGCPAMSPESEFITKLNTPRDNIQGIQYTNITTKYDELAAPYKVNFMYDEGNYQNILLQDYCPGLPLEHTLMMKTRLVWSLVIQALKGEKITPSCTLRFAK